MELSDNPAAGFGLREREMDGLFFFGQLDALDALQFFDATLYLLGFGRLIAEAVDEYFQLLDAVALIAVRRLQLFEPLLFSGLNTFRSCRDRNGSVCSRFPQSCRP